MPKTLAALALCVATSAAALAQNARAPIAPAPVVAPGQAEMMKLQMVMAAAQQAAIKPGDEALPCESLQKELISTMTDPAIQAYAAKTNAAYAAELAAQQKKGTTTAANAAALAAALTPGAGMAGLTPAMPPLAPGQAMTPQQMQQAVAAQQQMAITYMNQLAPIMPALMRSQRVSMLAVTKNCAWASGGLGLYPGVTPGSIPAIPAGAPRVR
ncbi:MAG TPA: hypothetical protein VM846_02320 [Vicinamibacterales bacterium]|nr:hypothetical protein [Vicinamibacterales bacterium]